MSGPLDYDIDNDPLGYMTSDYRSPYLAESALDMKRRFFLRGRSAPHSWQRVLVRLMLVIPFALVALVVVVGATQGIAHLLSK